MGTVVIPQLVNLGICSRCQEKVGWLDLPAGRQVQVDPRPSYHGTIALLADGRRGVDVALEVPWMPPLDRTGDIVNILYVRHRLTCDARELGSARRRIRR